MAYQDLITILPKNKAVYILTHNFPDPDAIASAFGLYALLKVTGYTCFIIYAGTLERSSLKQLINDLRIPAETVSENLPSETDSLVLIDTCWGKKNVSNCPGKKQAVIDHHQNCIEQECYADIRPEIGSCASIIYSYWKESERTIPENVATALLVGISIDTVQLTRSVSALDIEAYTQCFSRGDIQYVHSITRNNIQKNDLPYFKELIDSVDYQGNVAFAFFQNGCEQNLLGILANFLLSIAEINLAVVYANNPSGINFSVRSELPGLQASDLIQSALIGLGQGGGHADMAGGLITDTAAFDEEAMKATILNLLKQL